MELMWYRMSSIYDRKMLMDQREAEEDPIYALFFGSSPIQPVIQRICDYVDTLGLSERFLKIISYVRTTQKRIPKLAFILFVMWLFPEQVVEISKAQPRRIEPFMDHMETVCLNMLQGKYTNLTTWVGHTITDYLVTPNSRQETILTQSRPRK